MMILYIFIVNIHSYLYYIAQNFGRVATARKLAEKILAIGRGKAHSLLELTRPHHFLVDKTLADWQLTAKSAKVLCYMVKHLISTGSSSI